MKMSGEIPSTAHSDEIEILSFRSLSHQTTTTPEVTTESISIDAVRIRKAYKSYGKNEPILYDLNMTVSKGTM